MIKTSQQLKEERTAIVGQYDSLKALIATRTEDATAEEMTQLQGFVSRSTELDGKIKDAEQRETFEAAEAAKRASVKPVTHDKGVSKEDQDAFGNYRFMELVRQIKNGKLEGRYLEMHEEAKKEARDAGVTMNNFGVPTLVLQPPNYKERRDQLAGTTTLGGFSVEDTMGGYIPYLENNLILTQMGAKFVGGLVGDVVMPRADSSMTASWATEVATLTESSPTMDQPTLTPKRLGTYVDISNQLILQSSIGIERIIRERLFNSLKRGIENGAINGTGSAGQPTGLLNVSGIGSVVGGASGAELTWTLLHKLIKEVGIDNALNGSLGFLSNHQVTYKLNTTAKVSAMDHYLLEKGTIAGYKYGESQMMPANLVKGSYSDVSAIIFGDFSQLMIGSWGGLQIGVNPYTKMTEGITQLVAQCYVDVEVIYPQAFAAMLDVTTS